MADRGDTHYLTNTLNKWFLFSSLFLLVVTVWMMLDDWNAPWKQHQRDFRRIEYEKTQAALAAAETEPVKRGESELKAAVERANASLASRKGELDAVEKELDEIRAEKYVKDGEAKLAKADFDWARYLIEEHRTAHGDPNAQQDELEAALARVNETAFAKEDVETRLKAVEKRAADLTADVAAAEKKLAAETRSLDMMRKRLEQLQPSDKAVAAANVIRDAPGLDFIGPSLKVEKAVLDNLTFELNFTKTKRVDMCMTCHVAIDRAGFDEPADAEPLRTHPRLDLFLTAKSPHPIKDVGCTICHRGGGEALDFVRADHRPGTLAQEEEWQEKYHWHKQHHWDYPMLADADVEASCVQCHKTSMELIADEAPKVTEGYRLFEQYGCYSCHKVDWFPTARKPGPSLKNIQAKTRPEWIASWVTSPKAFRPTTWMPQVFHLENFAPDEVIANANYGAGPEIKGQQWNETAVAAVTAFVLDRAPKQAFAPMPVEGDPVRGREVFRVSGCLACHNVAPHDPAGGDASGTGAGAEAADDLAQQHRGTNEHGPNLRGIATKVDRDWLFWWIKDPTRYWPETRMPNMRLADQEAADVTAYMIEDPDGFFRDVPEGWAEKPSPVDVATLQEQARWFFSKLGRVEVQRRLEGESPEFPWNDASKLAVAVGEQFVMHQGCYSCHEIAGMEEMMPIGTELSNWGSKTVDKLDFGFAYQPLGSDRDKIADLSLLPHEYREGWLARKLHRPRSFDLQKVKNPKEKLRMPWFDFSDAQVAALQTFVLGLVDDEVQLAKMKPSAQDLSKDAGLRAIRQKNCVACHVLEPGSIEFRGEDGTVHQAEGELMALENAILPAPMDGKAELEAYLAKYETEQEETVDELGFRLLRPAPDLGGPGENVFFARKDLVDVRPPKGGKFVRAVADYYFRGAPVGTAKPGEETERATADPDGEGKVEDVDGKLRPYSEEPYDKVRWTFAPPVLIDEGEKLQREWFFAFLNDPMPLREQMRVRMPTFRYGPGEAGAIADYFALHAQESWPARYARTLRYVLGLQIDPKHAAEPRDWPEIVARKKGFEPVSAAELAAEAGIETATLLGIEAGSASDVASGFDKLRILGEKKGFRMHGPVDADYERVSRRAPSYLAARTTHMNGTGSPVALGHKVGIEGPNCYQCHFHQGLPPDQKEAPISWAPDLARVRERLREAWTEDWIWNPGLIYPGTSMPSNFLGDPPQYQQVYPNSTNPDQVQVVLDWLFNFDRDQAASVQR